MATIRIPILGFGANPDDSGDVYFTPLSTIAPTNDLYDTLVLVFNDTAVKDEVNGSFMVPKDYVGSPSAVIIWTANSATTNNVVWDFDYNSIAVDGTESADPSAHDQTATVTTAHGGTAMDVNTSSISLTAGNFAVDDIVLFQLGRDGAASDTLAADVAVLGALFQYDDA